MLELDPDVGQLPDADGLADWFEQSLAQSRPPGALWLVAEYDGQVAGFVQGMIEPPRADARWQLQRDLARHQLVIGALAVCVASRRSGIGTALMMAIEEESRACGAAVAVLDTSLLSDLSVPFYEDRMAYRRRAVIFRKALGRADHKS